MPASSEARNRWRKRKREHQIRKPKPRHDEEDDVLEDEDDEENDPDVDHQHQQSDAGERADNPSDPASSVAGEFEVIADGGVGLCSFPPVVRHAVNRPHSSVLAIVAAERASRMGESRRELQQNGVVLENISYGQLQALSAVPVDSPSLGVGDGEGPSSTGYVITPPAILEGRGVVKHFGPNVVHAVPMYSDWFSPNTINRIERQIVPHFFSGKSADHTPEKYMECRNRIVAKYIENPSERLQVSDGQIFIVDIDGDDVTRIVRFLDNWGIINYCASPLNNGASDDGPCLSEDLKGELCVPAQALKSIESLIQFEKPKCRLKAEDVYPELVSHGYKNSDMDSRIRALFSENKCNHCSRPLAVVYYQSQKEVDVLLCLDCFNEGRFVIGHSSLHFMRVDSTKDYGDPDGDSWTNQETLLLLEAIEIYNESWSEISEHVGTKSKAQCILHFVRLSTDDALLENIEVPVASTSSNLSNGDDCGTSYSKTNGNLPGYDFEDPDSESNIPFAKSENPVMSQVAFLAFAVGPRVAAACAHASLAALSEDDHKSMNGSASDDRIISESPRADISNSVQQSEEKSAAHVAPLSYEKVRNAARAGLAAAAMKAKLFADHEEREIQRLSANIINHQLKRLELKLKQFAEVETALMKECEQVERARQRIIAERALVVSSQFGPAGPSGQPSMPSVGSPLTNSNPLTNRQQVNPHMSQQPMYGLGPRLPLSVINPSSSSAPSNPMMRPVSGSRSGFD